MTFRFWEIDISVAITEWWKSLDKKYKFAFTACLVCNIFVYWLFISHYMMHNHGLRFPWINPHDQLFAGRWFAVFFYSLTGFANVPVLQQVLGIILNTSTVLLWYQLLHTFSQQEYPMQLTPQNFTIPTALPLSFAQSRSRRSFRTPSGITGDFIKNLPAPYFSCQIRTTDINPISNWLDNQSPLAQVFHWRKR